MFHSAEEIRTETLYCVTSFGCRRNLEKRGGTQYQDFPSKIFLSHSAEKISKGILLCFTNFGYGKKFCFRGLCHDFRFSVEIFCLTVPRNFVGEPFCAVFHKIFGSEKFMHRIGVEYQVFPSKTFCLTVPRIFVGKPFSMSLPSGAEKFWIREGEYRVFLSTFFCLTVPRNFVGEPFCAVFHNIFGSERFMHRIGVEYQVFPSKTFCLTVPRIFVGKPFSMSLTSGAEKFWIREGEYRVFLSTFFCLTVPKNFVGEPFCAVFQKNFR